MALPLSYVAITVNILLRAVKLLSPLLLCFLTCITHLPAFTQVTTWVFLVFLIAHLLLCPPSFLYSLKNIQPGRSGFGWQTNSIDENPGSGQTEHQTCVSEDIWLRGISKCLCRKCGNIGNRQHSQGFRSNVFNREPFQLITPSFTHRSDIRCCLYGDNRKNILSTIYISLVLFQECKAQVVIFSCHGCAARDLSRSASPLQTKTLPNTCSFSPQRFQISASEGLFYLPMSSCYIRFGVCECQQGIYIN